MKGTFLSIPLNPLKLFRQLRKIRQLFHAHKNNSFSIISLHGSIVRLISRPKRGTATLPEKNTVFASLSLVFLLARPKLEQRFFSWLLIAFIHVLKGNHLLFILPWAALQKANEEKIELLVIKPLINGATQIHHENGPTREKQFLKP